MNEREYLNKAYPYYLKAVKRIEEYCKSIDLEASKTLDADDEKIINNHPKYFKYCDRSYSLKEKLRHQLDAMAANGGFYFLDDDGSLYDVRRHVVTKISEGTLTYSMATQSFKFQDGLFNPLQDINIKNSYLTFMQRVQEHTRLKFVKNLDHYSKANILFAEFVKKLNQDQDAKAHGYTMRRNIGMQITGAQRFNFDWDSRIKKKELYQRSFCFHECLHALYFEHNTKSLVYNTIRQFNAPVKGFSMAYLQDNNLNDNLSYVENYSVQNQLGPDNIAQLQIFFGRRNGYPGHTEFVFSQSSLSDLAWPSYEYQTSIDGKRDIISIQDPFKLILDDDDGVNHLNFENFPIGVEVTLKPGGNSKLPTYNAKTKTFQTPEYGNFFLSYRAKFVKLTGSKGNDTLTGNDFDNEFYPKSGNDTINGEKGWNKVFFDQESLEGSKRIENIQEIYIPHLTMYQLDFSYNQKTRAIRVQSSFDSNIDLSFPRGIDKGLKFYVKERSFDVLYSPSNGGCLSRESQFYANKGDGRP